MLTTADGIKLTNGGHLTPSDIQLIQKLADGWTPEKIARHYGCTKNSVWQTCGRIRCRTMANTNEELVAIAFRHGLVK